MSDNDVITAEMAYDRGVELSKVRDLWRSDRYVRSYANDENVGIPDDLGDPELRNAYIQGWMDKQRDVRRPDVGVLAPGMIVSCLQENLQRALDISRHALPRKATLPILHNVLIETYHGKLRLVTTDLDLTIRVEMGAAVDRDGSTTAPHKELREMVREFSPERIDMTSTPFTYETGRGVVADGRTTLKCGASTATFKGLPAEEFPRQIDPEHVHHYTINPDVLIDAINKVEFCASTDDSRPILTGIYLESGDDETLHLTTADGFRLARHTVDLESGDPYEFGVTVPAKALSTAAKVIKSLKSPEPVYLTVPENDQFIILTTQGSMRVEFVISLIDGTFPDWTTILPETNTTVWLDRGDLLRQTKRANVIAKNSNNTVRFTFVNTLDKSLVRLIATNQETGDFEGVLSAHIEGKAIDRALNANYLITILNALDVDSIRIRLDGDTDRYPFVFEPVSDDRLTYLVMPMHIGR